MRKWLGKLLNYNIGIYFVVLLAFGIAAAVMEQYILAIAELLVIAVLFVLYLLFRAGRRNAMQAFLQKAEDKITNLSGAESPFPLAVVRLTDNVIVYANGIFAKVADFKGALTETLITDILPEFTNDWLASGKKVCPNDVSLGKRRYRMHGTAIRANDAVGTPMAVLYFTDLTELYQVRDEYIRSRPVVAIILVDNYEELTRNMSEAATSGLNARINNTISKWAQDYHGLLRRLERNRFLLIFEKRDLKQAMDGKFAILEQIHDITGPSGLETTISFGLGVDGATFEEGYQFAALAIEMALSRGGDQAVVKDRLNFSFYGGRTKEAAQRSKVHSRVTANSMMELIGQSSHVFIMGHKNADADAVGAAMGVACLCRKKGKPFNIVLDVENNACQNLIEEIAAEPEYKKAFISGQDALLLCDNRSTLIVVDTNRPDQVEYRALLESIPRTCVIDHHRRAADYIQPVVNFHEPYASSASELATELLQYAVDQKDVLAIEAKALMAGIFLDTKSFRVRTGDRTFEAAAYLRQLGADMVDVNKLFRNDFQETMAKYQIIKSARLYRQEIAIAALNSPAPRALAAQAADELLNISGITASFVLYPDEDKIVISARSVGDANVQVILESLGGGGNMATAGAQVSGSTVKDVLDQLVESIDRYYES
ncbi:MAG: DHH family phosphoesterase [Oscillospiraceae bacterium]|nr:DHH family phosphoesterase [Oscillospiraceae bacterium]